MPFDSTIIRPGQLGFSHAGEIPRIPLKVNWKHPMARGLASAYVTGQGHDLVSGIALDMDTEVTEGKVLSTTATSNYGAKTGTVVPAIDNLEFSSFSRYKPTNLGVRRAVWQQGWTSSQGIGVAHGYSNTSAIFAYMRRTNAQYATETATGFFVLNEWVNVGFSFQQSDQSGGFYKNGAPIGSFSTGGTQTPTAGTTFALLGSSEGGGSSNIRRAVGEMEFNFVWVGRKLTDLEHYMLDQNPMMFLEPAIPQHAYFAPSSGTSYTLTAEAGSFTITGQDANLEHHRSLAADAGSFTITGFDATLTYNPVQSYTLTADAGSFVITGSPATLTYNSLTNWTQQNPT